MAVVPVLVADMVQVDLSLVEHAVEHVLGWVRVRVALAARDQRGLRRAAPSVPAVNVAVNGAVAGAAGRGGGAGEERRRVGLKGDLERSRQIREGGRGRDLRVEAVDEELVCRVRRTVMVDLPRGTGHSATHCHRVTWLALGSVET